MIIRYNPAGLILGMQGFFNVWKTMWYSKSTNWIKTILSSQYLRKLFTKFNTHLWLKTLQKVGIEGIYFNIIKAIYDIANIILTDEKKQFLLRSGKKQGFPLLPLLFNAVLESIAMAIRGTKKKERKGIQFGKEVKLSLFADYMILYRCYQKTIRAHQSIWWSCKIQNKQKSISFLFINNWNIREIKKTTPLKNKIPSNKPT